MRHIFLLGLSGSGKSTVGRMLAQRLRYPLLDIDALIEEASGERIAAIFERHGEDYFRNLESRILARAVSYPECAVIVTGAGIVGSTQNRSLMATSGTRIYMQVDPSVAIQRIREQHIRERADGTQLEVRPLLAGPDPVLALQNLLTARVAWYQEAEIVCSTQEKSAEQVAEEIIAMLSASDDREVIEPIIRHVHISSGYDTIVEWNGLRRLPLYLSQLQLPPRIFVITDSHIAALYAEPLMQSLSQAGFTPFLYQLPAGEASKSQEQVTALYDWLIGHHAERREALIALGGGMVGDLVGFVAATYLRGVPFVQVPTSLLAQVDAAIGGKTGINHPKGKNLIGAFYHPRLVLADPATLLTLPVRSRTEGWAEIVKYGIILDAELFALLEDHADELREFVSPSVALLSRIIARCIELKVQIIEQDEREQGQRVILNYGHTFAHALENVSGYGEWLHGEAVSLGMVVAATLARASDLCPPDLVNRQNALLLALGLPVRPGGAHRASLQAQDILSAMQVDKKVVGQRVRWVLPRKIGDVVVMPLPDDLVRRLVTAFCAGENIE